MMVKIAATMMSDTDRRQYPDELIFAVMHTSNLIEDLLSTYSAGFNQGDAS